MLYRKGRIMIKQLAMALLVLCSGYAALGQAPGAQSAGAGDVQEIKMTAKKYEFSPKEIHVKQGQKVLLLITALDRKHGFEIKPLGIKMDLEQGKETAVEFTAT